MKKKPAKSRKPEKAKAKVKARTKVKAKAKVKKSSPKKSPAKARAKKKEPAAGSIPRSKVIAPANSVLLGVVEDYFAKIGVIALTLKAPLSLGRRIQVLGHTTHLEQAADSMQIDHVPVTQAAAKSAVGIKVTGRARAGDHVYLLK